MSRSLKFQIENEKEITQAQLRRLYNISNFYSNHIRWTMDAFTLGPGKIEPVLYDHLSEETCWSIMDKSIQNYVVSGDHYIDAVFKVVENGQARSMESLHSKTYRSEVRVLGNESNARDVVKALDEISLVFPKSTIYVTDEGHYLYTNLIIRRGAAIPDLRWLNSFMRDFISFVTSFQGDVELNITDREMLNFYVKDCEVRMKSLSITLNKLKTALGIDKLMPEDLENIPQKNWPNVEFYTRPINLEDFENYTSLPSNLMGGYFGEYWNLVNIDVEAESYRLLGSIQSHLSKTDPKFELNVF